MSKMSTNIEDINDPNIVLLDDNTSNIKMKKNIENNITNIETTFFNDHTILILVLLIVSALPQTDNILMYLLPNNYNDSLYVIIFKVILLFLIYVLVNKYVIHC